ncbi:MAG: zinc ribbon domain-containing protein [Thermoplasmatales archaeon]|nr:zinc ribbon domain-containing protein [Thermoplasmatales archaeon]
MNLSKRMSLIALTCIVMSLAITAIVSAYDYDGDGIDDGSWDDYYGASQAAWTFLGISGVICFVVFIFLPLIIGILIAIWVYKDAEKRGSSGVMWLIIVILLNIVGLIIWLVVRPPIGGPPQQQQQASGRMCTNCGRPIPMDAQVCPYCGKNFQQK